MAEKKMVLDFMRMKQEGEKITFLTAYDYPTALFAEAAGLDMLLVGDSLGPPPYHHHHDLLPSLYLLPFLHGMDICLRSFSPLRHRDPLQ